MAFLSMLHDVTVLATSTDNVEVKQRNVCINDVTIKVHM